MRAVNQVRGGSEKGRAQKSVRGRQELCAAESRLLETTGAGGHGATCKKTGRGQMDCKGTSPGEKAGVIPGSGVLKAAGCALPDLLDSDTCDPV